MPTRGGRGVGTLRDDGFSSKANEMLSSEDKKVIGNMKNYPLTGNRQT
jgi:hypothetical protein